MLMNKKGFTLVELIAVVVIMSIIAMIAAPNIINLMDTSKKSDFVADAKEFISKAKYMEKLKDIKKYEGLFNEEGVINLEEVVNLNDYTSPYGNSYISCGEGINTECSYIQISYESVDSVLQKTVKIYLTDGTHFISASENSNNPIDEKELDVDYVFEKNE